VFLWLKFFQFPKGTTAKAAFSFAVTEKAGLPGETGF
jgi:hypothetical protein